MKARHHLNQSEPRADAAGTHSEGERHPGMLEVHAATAEELDQKLKEAIDIVARAAAHHHIGVLVTPTGPARYIVRAHPAVPYGMVRQQPA
ncbi:hypothetical protein AB0N65_11240 [Paenarthrobacter sp. NPDC089322]|uniref:hypothetical protein n=1 Tax=Paenarthrobacter sp. NPDC089322 TaxID=3155065 RepID=UPI003446098A